jgi:hypothetical protein
LAATVLLPLQGWPLSTIRGITQYYFNLDSKIVLSALLRWLSAVELAANADELKLRSSGNKISKPNCANSCCTALCPISSVM